MQVGILEAGHVLVQYRGLDDAALAEVRALAGKEVVVAPDPDLRPGQVVATAWVYKRTCTGVDQTGLGQFITERHGHGPGYHAEH